MSLRMRGCVTRLCRVLQAGGGGAGGGVGMTLKLPHLWLTGGGSGFGSLTSALPQQPHRQPQQHQQGPLDPRPHACSFCGRRFKRSDHRRQHERLHTGEKPYGCAWCGAKFAQQSGLHYHKLNSCREEQRTQIAGILKQNHS